MAHQTAVPALVSTLSISIVFLPMFFLTGGARYLFVRSPKRSPSHCFVNWIDTAAAYGLGHSETFAICDPAPTSSPSAAWSGMQTVTFHRICKPLRADVNVRPVCNVSVSMRSIFTRSTGPRGKADRRAILRGRSKRRLELW
jgi:hypothetical protein